LLNLEEAQCLLDSGLSRTKVADSLDIHHSKICRLIERGVLEEYIAFDEFDYEVKEVEILSDFQDEDLLDKYLYDAFDGDIYIQKGAREYSLSRYIKKHHGDILKFLKRREYVHLTDNIHIECQNCKTYHKLSDFYPDGHNFMGVHCKKLHNDRIKRFFSENPNKTADYNFRRRSAEHALPYENDTTLFNVCAITGSYKFSIDHFIALNTGHGGSYFENYMPLSRELNSSKNNKNPFKWVSFRNIDRRSFNLEVARLSMLNRLTPDEYRQFVYWCYDNKRDIDEIKRDQRHSIEIWREAVGKQFPLPRYVYDVGFLNESEVS
jgi:hypothetical protein